eukprot:1183711-Prorocentrum_minimum.AAC.1
MKGGGGAAARAAALPADIGAAKEKVGVGYKEWVDNKGWVDNKVWRWRAQVLATLTAAKAAALEAVRSNRAAGHMAVSDKWAACQVIITGPSRQSVRVDAKVNPTAVTTVAPTGNRKTLVRVLRDALLRDAVLRDGILREAVLRETVLGNAALREAVLRGGIPQYAIPQYSIPQYGLLQYGIPWYCIPWYGY